MACFRFEDDKVYFPTSGSVRSFFVREFSLSHSFGENQTLQFSLDYIKTPRFIYLLLIRLVTSVHKVGEVFLVGLIFKVSLKFSSC